MVRFCALFRIKQHGPPLEQISANFFDFQSCDRTNQAECLRVNFKNEIKYSINKHSSLIVWTTRVSNSI